MAGYKIELLVNGVARPEYTITRYHPANVRDVLTLSGTAKLILSQNDTVTIRVTPLPLNVYLQHKLQYFATAFDNGAGLGGSVFKVERQRLW